jgi:putative ABC transport system permease protein
VTLNELMMSLEIGLIYGVVAIGIYITFRIIDFPDLTCDGSFALGAAASGMIIKAGYNPFFALFAAIIAGGLAGSITGLLNTRLKIINLLSGILTAFMLYSINLKVMNGAPNISLLGYDTIFSHTNLLVMLLLICVVIAMALGYLLSTDFGLAFRVIGQNKRLALNGGVSVNFMTLVGLILSNGLIALGGALFSQHQGFADVGSGVGTIIIALASVMIGERILGSRSIWFGILGCMLGSILYRIFISFALHSEVLGLETQDLNLITGLMVIGVMVLPKRVIC